MASFFRTWFPPTAVAFLIFWLVLSVLLSKQPFDDPGALWHVRVGEIILTQGFPSTDPFTFAFADRNWIPQQWLGEIVMFGLHRIAGLDAMLLGMTVLLAGFAAWLVARYVAAGLQPLFAGLLVGFGFFTASYHFYCRPHLATIVLMGMLVGWLVDVERGRRSLRSLFWLIPLIAVWTNLHGGVLGGLITLVATFALWCGCFLFRLETPVRRASDVGLLAVVLTACFAATLINPFGIELHRTWLSIVGTKTVQLLLEHKPLNPTLPSGRVTLIYGAFVALLLAGTLPRWPRATWMLPLLWLLAACTSIRHGPLFCAASLVVVADIFPETCWFRWLRRHGDTLIREPSQPGTGFRACLTPFAAVLLALGLQIGKIHCPPVGFGWAQLDPVMVPTDLIPEVQEYAASRPAGTPIFNDANLGGFLIYFAPNQKIFMDDRFELYRDEAFLDYVKMRDENPEMFEEWASRFPFDRALIEKLPTETKLAAYMRVSPDWRLLKEDQRAMWFARISK